MSYTIPRPEYPRPDFERQAYQNLNGLWQFDFDDDNAGLREGWYAPEHELSREITVPFVYQCAASGIADTSIHPWMWYKRSFTLDAGHEGERTLLHFGAVDYSCRVYLNGQLAAMHKGGYTPFHADVTLLLKPGENCLCVYVEDLPDRSQPRGKQYWQEGVMGCWYTPCSGIWQTVWLEWVKDVALERIHITPDVDRHQALFELSLDRQPTEDITARVVVSLNGSVVRDVSVGVSDRRSFLTADMLATQESLDGMRLWRPDAPTLYDVRVTLLRGGAVLDEVSTYFGMRKVEVINGRLYLNGERLYLRLVLDQGYWPDTLLTPPSDEAIQRDIRLTLAMGFNGARKHQKIEDPRYYYWADRMGLLVWGEVPSCYEYTDESVRNLAETVAAFIDRDYNHPSIITWVPLNESWGVPHIRSDKRQQSCARMLYHMTKAMDGTRLASCNDGWEQTTTDICALHDYSDSEKIIASHFASRETVEQGCCDRRACYAQGETPAKDALFMITEYGGIAMDDQRKSVENMATWGYHDKVRDEESFFKRYGEVTDAIRAIPYCEGFCYTQLTDVMQEINGLLLPDRQCKVAMDRLRTHTINPVGK